MWDAACHPVFCLRLIIEKSMFTPALRAWRRFVSLRLVSRSHEDDISLIRRCCRLGVPSQSAVTAILRSEGLVVVDADEVAREVVRPGAWGYRRLLARFGTEILHADGAINRELLRTITIGENGSTQKRRQLNDATHLPIAARILTLLFYHAVVRGNPRVFLDAPLLYETGMHRLCRCVWVVTCSPEVQTARIMARDSVSKEEAEAAVATQWPLQRKVDLADAVIDNNGQRSLLQPAVLTLLQRLS